MGSTRWSDDHYNDRVNLRCAAHTPTFAHSHAISTGKAEAKTHDKLNPKDVKMRESRDSDTNPNSHAVVVLCDVTGSMSKVPSIVQKKLPQLMGLLMRHGYLSDPHIMIGAIGDATCDTAPLQVGQFEAGIEIEDDLTNLYLEGGGGGQTTESYELALYFIDKHTDIDCWNKRQKKGYLFIIGDEMPYGVVNKAEVEKWIGEKIQANRKVEEVIESVRERYEIFMIIPNLTSNYENKEVRSRWKELLGQSVLFLEDPEGICELIASTVGLAEGKVEHAGVSNDLESHGVAATLANVVSRALVSVKDTKAIAKKGSEISVTGSGATSGIATL